MEWEVGEDLATGQTWADCGRPHQSLVGAGMGTHTVLESGQWESRVQ